MRYSDVLTQIGDEGARSHLLFETFSLALLREHLRHQQKQLITERGRLKVDFAEMRPDAVAPDGVDNLPGPTLVEVKYWPGPRNPPGSGYFSQTVMSLGASAYAGHFRSVLLIVGEALPNWVHQQLVSLTASWPTEVPFRIWDGSRLDRLIEQHEAFVADVLPQLGRMRLEQAVTDAETERRSPTQRDELLADLRRAYSAGDLALFLGAGVSMDAGVPSWDALLEMLLVRLVDGNLRPTATATDDEVVEIASRLQAAEVSSPLLAARYVRRGIDDLVKGSGGGFVQEVTRALYRKLPLGATPSALLQTMADLARPHKGVRGVRSVVTYNFDDLLEVALERAGVQHRSIFSEGAVAALQELPVQHVHGFLPRDRSKYPGIEGATWAFSEEGYHILFNDPYHWSNLVQLNTLREQTCLLVGLSLADPNLRRLLAIASKRNGADRHVVVLRRTLRSHLGNAKCTACGTALPELAARPEVVDAFLVRHEALHAELFGELGLRTLWVDEYSDIPDVLRSVRRQP